MPELSGLLPRELLEMPMHQEMMLLTVKSPRDGDAATGSYIEERRKDTDLVQQRAKKESQVVRKSSGENPDQSQVLNPSMRISRCLHNFYFC